MSDPPQLLKKLWNNIYNSGYKEESARYSRCMMLGFYSHPLEPYLLGLPIETFIFTDMKTSHVHLDSLR